MPSVTLTVQEGISLLRQYCNFQERCHQDVRTKGLALGFRGDDLEQIIAAMITDELLDEERYARSMARGKFRNNEWGRVKIIQALKQHAIPEYCIRKALTEIDDQDYRQVIVKLIQTKKRILGIKDKPSEIKKKIINYLLQKGYEFEYILQELQAIDQ